MGNSTALHWRRLLTEQHIGAVAQQVGTDGDAVPVALYVRDAVSPQDEHALHWIQPCGVWDAIDQRSDAAGKGRPFAEHTHQLVARALVRCNTMSTAGPLGAWSLTVWPLTTEFGDLRPQGALLMLRPARRAPEDLAATVAARYGVTLGADEVTAANDQLERARRAAASVQAELTDLAAEIVQQLTAEAVVADRGSPLGAPWDVSQLRQIVQAMGSGLVVTDPAGVVELCNPKARALLGTELERTALARRFEGHQAVSEALATARNSSDDTPVSVEVAAAVDGQARLFSLVITPIRVGAVVSGLVVVVRDMTRARDLDSLREDFLSSVNHELRTPLATLRGVATTLKDEPDMELGDRTEFLAILDREARRVAVLVEDMLAMTRLDARQAPLVTHRLDLQVHLAELVGSFRAECEAASIALEVVVPDDTVWVAANAGLLSQLGHNLVGNALKFAPDGGRIGLTLALAGDDAVRLEVSDDGPGLSLEDQRTAFQRFYRSSRAARVVTGSGLGLSLVKRIADAHGWTVELTSEPGRGTTVGVVIPRLSGADG